MNEFQPYQPMQLDILNPPQQQTPFGMTYREWFGFKKDLEAKKAKVRKRVETIEKNFVNVEENYSSTEAGDIYDAVRKIMEEERLGFNPEFLYEEETKTTAMEGMVKVYMQVTWTDLDNGYFESQKWVGYGKDNGDKGAYKAYTGAIKYALQLTFLISAKNPTPETGKQSEGEQADANEFIAEMQRQEAQQAQEETKEEAKPVTFAKREDAEEKPQEPQEAGEGITPVQVGIIKVKLDELAGFTGCTDSKEKKQANYATLSSLTMKSKLRAYGDRIKGEKNVEKMIAALLKDEAEFAIQNLDEWLRKKQAANVKKETVIDKNPQQQEANW